MGTVFLRRVTCGTDVLENCQLAMLPLCESCEFDPCIWYKISWLFVGNMRFPVPDYNQSEKYNANHWHYNRNSPRFGVRSRAIPRHHTRLWPLSVLADHGSWCHQPQIDLGFFGKYMAMCSWWCHDNRRLWAWKGHPKHALEQELLCEQIPLVYKTKYENWTGEFHGDRGSKFS